MFKSPLGTMHRANILLVCAVMAAASLLVTCHGLFDYRYFDPALLIEQAQGDIEETKSALKDLRTIESDLPEMVMSRIITAYQLDKLEDKKKFVLGCLMELFDASHSSSYPSVDLVRQVMLILEILKDRSDESFDIFAGFLRHYGSVKFSRLLNAYILLLQKELNDHPEAERKLDLVFSVDTLREEADRAKRLGEIEWSNGKFEVPEAIRAILKERNLSAVEEPYRLLFEYLSEHCNRMRLGRELLLSGITIAYTLGVNCIFLPPRVRKLTEYVRLCAGWRNEDTRKMLLEQKPHFFI